MSKIEYRRPKYSDGGYGETDVAFFRRDGLLFLLFETERVRIWRSKNQHYGYTTVPAFMVDTEMADQYVADLIASGFSVMPAFFVQMRPFTSETCPGSIVVGNRFVPGSLDDLVKRIRRLPSFAQVSPTKVRNRLVVARQEDAIPEDSSASYYVDFYTELLTAADVQRLHAQNKR